MGIIESLSLALGTAWTSGINLYATVAVVGLAGRLGMIQLPPDLLILTDPLVIGVALVMYVIEFFADKIPYVDNGWDVLHTFIRIPAGAILAARALGDLNPALELAAILAGGTVALAAHGTKATVRLAINVSPEPVSNWIASIGEDLAVLGGIWLAFNHPILMLALVIGFTLLAIWLIPKMYRTIKRAFQVLRAWLEGKKDEPAPAKPTPHV
ncbi:MAG: DUF4126 domain-containing protein [Deltaproteobacteria bacterium]|nr:DUF4126 domain-containing protein [Deltaproteobacteria bacterium]